MEVMQKKGYIFFFGSYCVHKFLKSSRVKAEKCIVCIACAYSKVANVIRRIILIQVLLDST